MPASCTDDLPNMGKDSGFPKCVKADLSNLLLLHLTGLVRCHILQLQHSAMFA